MPISEELRNELAAVEPKRRCDRLAELSGLFHTSGSVHLLGRGELAVHLDLAGSAVARRAFALLRDSGLPAEIRTYRRRSFGGETRYQIHVEGTGRALQLLHEAGILGRALGPVERPPRRVVARACCRGAYLRGALLGGGSLSGPRAPHLEIRTATRAGADFLAALASELGTRLGVVERRSHAAAYAKGTETIADVLAAAGAGDAVLAFEERAVFGATRARANRLANADHANLVRTSRAAHAQVLAVRRLTELGRLDHLSPALREAAELRVKYPSASLRELASKCRPPASKPSIHRRLSKVVRLADESSG